MVRVMIKQSRKVHSAQFREFGLEMTRNRVKEPRLDIPQFMPSREPFYTDVVTMVVCKDCNKTLLVLNDENASMESLDEIINSINEWIDEIQKHKCEKKERVCEANRHDK